MKRICQRLLLHRIASLKDYPKVIEKHRRWSIFLMKRFQHICFPKIFAYCFTRTFLQNISRWLVKIKSSYLFLKKISITNVWQGSQLLCEDFSKWTVIAVEQHCVKSAEIRSFFWSVFSHIRTEYGDLIRKLSHLVWIRQSTDQKKLRIWTLFTQWQSPWTMS